MMSLAGLTSRDFITDCRDVTEFFVPNLPLLTDWKNRNVRRKFFR